MSRPIVLQRALTSDEKRAWRAFQQASQRLVEAEKGGRMRSLAFDPAAVERACKMLWVEWPNMDDESKATKRLAMALVLRAAEGNRG